MILENIPERSILRNEELFGPVFSLFKIKGDGVDIANSSEYGLGASVMTGDLEEGEKIALQIESGAVFVNDFTKSHSKLPSGGMKNSGYGRECSDHGIKEFTNIKTIVIQK